MANVTTNATKPRGGMGKVLVLVGGLGAACVLCACAALGIFWMLGQNSDTPTAGNAAPQGFKQYVDQVDCSVNSPDFGLKSFSVLYPANYDVVDCDTDPENYVKFVLYQDSTKKNVKSSISLGYFSLDAPYATSYASSGNQLLESFTTLLRSQGFDLQLVKNTPLNYNGQKFYRGDYIFSTGADKGILRMITIPNLKTGQGLFMVALTTSANPTAAAFQDFDQGVVEKMFESVKF